ncbi:ABC transporter [Streptomyces sp. WAC 01529]|uniref:ABC transporter ATP-binding protein n=1 Tax=Streptomyces sp. WAC 01529 TaxID=2203205 RepID=UPI000F6E779A|nr:ATP-binding cassette domain-containing protein [Streptomyces sp. WAC 01529]AZM56138.1 ABC transporter [Streptomyces sp. WAC 01529]
MERDLVVRLGGVGRRYGVRGPWVLRGVDLGVRAGALVRVEGANGSGKSTLLRLLAGIDAPSEGRVTGRPRTAYVPERFPAAMPFTAIGYLTHMARIHGVARGAASRGAAARSAERWLERFGAAEYARTPLSELSKGSSQKVAVAQALLAAPDLLVLDEAWTGLDAPARAELDRAVAERTAAGGAVAFVDHDPGRLAGAVDETYGVVGTGPGEAERVPRALRIRRGWSRSSPHPQAAPPLGALMRGRHVVIETRGPRGAELPAPVAAAATVVTDAPEGAIRFTVPESRSDLVLRELLTAGPPWHVVTVTRAPAGAPVPPQAPAQAPTEGRGR